jgi:hypothetical protein
VALIGEELEEKQNRPQVYDGRFIFQGPAKEGDFTAGSPVRYQQACFGPQPGRAIVTGIDCINIYPGFVPYLQNCI